MKRRLRILLGLALLLPAAALMLYGRWSCPILLITGVPCPGCGMLTALRYLMQGNVQAALQSHPLVLVLPVGFVAFGGLYLFGKLSGLFVKMLLGLFVLAMLAAWAFRLFGAAL